MTKITTQAQNLKNALNVAMKTCNKSKGYALDPENDGGIERPVFVRNGGALVVVMPVKLREGR